MKEPLEFEKKLYADFSDHSLPLEELGPYKRLHSLLLLLWDILDRDGTYGGIIPPMGLEL